MSELHSLGSVDRDRQPSRADAQHPRTIGSPLPMGIGRRLPPAAPENIGARIPAAPLPERSLPAPPRDQSPGVQRAVNVFRTIVPIVQTILPLLDGKVGTAIGSLLAPRPHSAAQPQPKIDLVPLEHGLAALQTQHHSLREQVMEQNTSLKRVEDQLEMVREATDRNTLEQQELLEDLKHFSSRVKAVAFVGLGLLAVTIALNVILFLHIKRVLP